MTSRSRAPRGFTLVEVTLALAILAFGLVSVMVARGRAVETALAARNLKIARLLAGSLLREVAAGLHEDLLDGTTGDFSEAGYPSFEWLVAIGEESVAAAGEKSDDRTLAGFYAERQVKRDRAEAAGEELPEEPFTPVAVRVTFPTLAEERAVFTLQALVETKILKGDFAEEGSPDSEATSGENSPAGGSSKAR